MFELFPVSIGVILALICIYLVYTKSSKPLYNIPRLIITGLIADLFIMIFIYLLIGEEFTEISVKLAIYMTILTFANLTLMIAGSSTIALLVHPMLNRGRIIILSSLVGFTVASSISVIMASYHSQLEFFEFFILILSLIILLDLIIWVIFSAHDLKKGFQQGQIGIPSGKSPWMVYILLVIISIIPLIIVTLVTDFPTNNIIISLNGIVLGIMIFYFKGENQLIFLFPSKHNLLLISDYHGSLKYSYNFALMPVSESRESLLAGWLTGISHILSEFFDRSVKPKEIRLDENRIYLHWADHYVMAFITDQQSSLYLQALNQLGENLNRKFGLQVELLFSNAKYLDLKDLVEESFDFI